MSEYLSVAEVAAAVGVGRTTIQHHCRAGHLPGVMQVGRAYLVPARYADPAIYKAAVGRPGRAARSGAGDPGGPGRLTGGDEPADQSLGQVRQGGDDTRRLAPAGAVPRGGGRAGEPGDA